METKFNFNSQVCTSREQSERLLALGLKKETADMLILSYSTEQDIIALPWSESGGWTRDNSIPAWSLHRLMALNKECCIEFINETAIDNAYDVMIDEIELAIKNRQFNNAYLE